MYHVGVRRMARDVARARASSGFRPLYIPTASGLTPRRPLAVVDAVVARVVGCRAHPRCTRARLCYRTLRRRRRRQRFERASRSSRRVPQPLVVVSNRHRAGKIGIARGGVRRRCHWHRRRRLRRLRRLRLRLRRRSSCPTRGESSNDKANACYTTDTARC